VKQCFIYTLLYIELQTALSIKSYVELPEQQKCDTFRLLGLERRLAVRFRLSFRDPYSRAGARLWVVVCSLVSVDTWAKMAEAQAEEINSYDDKIPISIAAPFLREEQENTNSAALAW
jgi:hypothetical protein